MTTPRQAIFGTDEQSTESKSIHYKPLRSPNALTSTPSFKARTPAFSDAPAVQMELLDIETFSPHHTNSHRIFALTTGFGAVWSARKCLHCALKLCHSSS
ncbi:hypothetical protein AVEN_212481-1 [Araneus ventricosus]|uniref:Uncharacterized protein n=1 Tax=Araneus ventricosus TaxID=182803 RepID=A0A4Y2K477_ARAVE|nr:hypothetical protein AVEN_212481-1 [Araneus ventricosus]